LVFAKQNITIDATDEAIAYLANKGYGPTMNGARPTKKVSIQQEVLKNNIFQKNY